MCQKQRSKVNVGGWVVGVQVKYRYSSQFSCYCTDTEQSLLKLSRACQYSVVSRHPPQTSSVLRYTGSKINGTTEQNRERAVPRQGGAGWQRNGDVTITFSHHTPPSFLPLTLRRPTYLAWMLVKWIRDPSCCFPSSWQEDNNTDVCSVTTHNDTPAVLNLPADAKMCLDNANIFQCLIYFVLVETTKGTTDRVDKHPGRQLIFLVMINT